MLAHEKIVEAVKKAAKTFPLANAEYFGSTISILEIIRLKRFLEEELATAVDVIHAPIPEGAIIEIGKTVSVL